MVTASTTGETTMLTVWTWRVQKTEEGEGCTDSLAVLRAHMKMKNTLPPRMRAAIGPKCPIAKENGAPDPPPGPPGGGGGQEQSKKSV